MVIVGLGTTSCESLSALEERSPTWKVETALELALKVVVAQGTSLLEAQTVLDSSWVARAAAAC